MSAFLRPNRSPSDAGGEQQAGEHDRVRVDDPLQLRALGAEVAHDRRQRDVEDRVVDADDDEREAEHGERHPPPLVDLLGRHRHPMPRSQNADAAEATVSTTSSSGKAVESMTRWYRRRSLGITVEQPLHEPCPRLVGVLLVRLGDVFGDALDGGALCDPSLDGSVDSHVERRGMRREDCRRTAPEDHARRRSRQPATRSPPPSGGARCSGRGRRPRARGSRAHRSGG